MKFVAFERSLQGTGASRRLRNAGKVPGIVYGAGEPAMVELDHNALYHAMRNEAFHSSVLDMELNGQTTKVLLRDYQAHPYKRQVLHLDFQRVDSTTRITKKVPLHFVNEAESPAVKQDKCIINHVTTALEIECLAEQLPEFITVDLANAVKGQIIQVEDLNLASHIQVLTHGRKAPTIATVVEPVEEVIVAAPVVADTGKGKKKK